MIYCFSGTGNSRFVAQQLVDIDSDDTLGFVFPVYAWGMPSQVKQDIMNLDPEVIARKPYVYAIMTCGDDMGLTDKELSRLLKKYCNLELNAAFSVQMPNTYVCLPGFDVDSDEVASAKVNQTLARLPYIKANIKERKHITDVHRGIFPLTKSYLLRPFFNKFLITDKYFHVDKETCIGCGLCQKTCPRHNITLEDKHPTWNGNCCNCLGCYHVCPKHAINWGKYTIGKGQKKKVLISEGH